MFRTQSQWNGQPLDLDVAQISISVFVIFRRSTVESRYNTGNIFAQIVINPPGYWGCIFLRLWCDILYMNENSMVIAASRSPGEYSTRGTVIEDEDAVQDVLDALHNENCQAILELTSGTARSAKEISRRCELPLSTTYRKLQLLTETGLLEKQTQIRRSGKHTNEYVRSVTDVLASVTAHGQLTLQLFQYETVDFPAPDETGD